MRWSPGSHYKKVNKKEGSDFIDALLAGLVAWYALLVVLIIFEFMSAQGG